MKNRWQVRPAPVVGAILALLLVFVTSCEVTQITEVDQTTVGTGDWHVDHVDISLNQTGPFGWCPVEILLSVDVQGTGELPAPTVQVTGGTIQQLSATVWRWIVNQSGTFHAYASAGGVNSGQVTITVNCPTTPPPPPERVLTYINYEPAGGTLKNGQTQQLTPVCMDQDHVVMACPSNLVWVSTNPGIVHVTQAGLITCLGPTSDGNSAQVSVQVPGGGPSNRHAWTCEAVVAATLTISPPNPTISLGTVNGVCVAETQFYASLDGQSVTPTWHTTGEATIYGGLFRTGKAATYTVTASHQGQTAQTTATVTGSCPATSGVTSIGINPASYQLYEVGCSGSGVSSVQMGHTIQTFGGASTAVTWETSNPSVVIVSPTGVITAAGVGQTNVTVRSVADPSMFATSVITVVACPAPPPPTACPTAIDYSPKGGLLYVSQNKALSLDPVSNWPSHCDVIWYTGKASVLHVNGGDNVRQVEGLWFYSGRNASIRGVAPGSAPACAHVITIDPTTGKSSRVAGGEKCHTWNVENAPAGLMFGLMNPVELKYMDLLGVTQTPPWFGKHR